MTHNEFMEKIRGVRKSCWLRHGSRAPHKPLLLLLALGRLAGGGSRLALYEQLEAPLTELLQRFGPHRPVHCPERPFWHLRTNKLWEIPDIEVLMPHLTRGRRPTPNLLVGNNITGGFPEQIYNLLIGNPGLIREAAKELLYQNFPETWHDDILSAIGLSLDGEERVAPGLKRDPRFRENVLRAYGRRCAVCNFDVRLDDNLFGLEAAHIKWHAAGGPDEVVNGLALCSAHHRAFDRGALGLVQDSPKSYRVVVSDLVSGLSNAAEELLNLHRAPLRRPRNDHHLPDSGYIEWHRKQIFRGKVISGG